MSITVENISFSYFDKSAYARKALDNISLELKTGQFTAVTGPTGCGKSTLLQILAGLLCPRSGRVLLDGEDINDKAYNRKKLRKKLGIVFQFPEYQLFEPSVFLDVGFALKQLGYSEEEKRRAVKKALELMGFQAEKIYEKSPLELSGGQKRLAAIAGILAAEPEYLLLDEPVAGLDSGARESFLKLLDELRDGGTAVIMVSHSANAVAEHADRIILMNDGKLIADEPPALLYASGSISPEDENIPNTVKLRELLRAEGAAVPQDIYREMELCEALTALLRGKGI